MPINNGFRPKMLGLGQTLPAASMAAAAAPQPQPTAPQAAGGFLDGSASNGLPAWANTPLGAFGLVLQEGAAGYRGQRGPLQGLIQQGKEDEAFEAKKLDYGIQLMSHAAELSKSVPPDKREKIFAHLNKQAQQFFPGIDLQDFISKASDNGMLDKVLAAGEYGPLAKAAIASRAEGQGLDSVLDPRFLDMISTLDDGANRRSILAKSDVLTQALGDQSMSMTDLEQMNGQIKEELRFSPSELATLRRDEGLQHQLGLRTASQEIAAQRETERRPDSVRVVEEIRRMREAGDNQGADLLEQMALRGTSRRSSEDSGAAARAAESYGGGSSGGDMAFEDIPDGQMLEVTEDQDLPGIGPVRKGERVRKVGNSFERVQ